MHPILLHFKFPIYSYGVCVAIAFLLGYYLVLKKAAIENIQKEFISDLLLVIIISGIVGSRLLYVVFNIRYFMDNPFEIVMINRGGLIVYGGIIATFIVTSIYTTMKGHKFFFIADLVVPFLALGQSLGRIGCYLNGCCYGKVTSFPVGVAFPRYSLPYFNHIDKGFINGDMYASLPVHPAQLYSSGLDLLIFVVLLLVYDKRKWNGQVFWLYVVLYPLKRFFVEFFRGDSAICGGGMTIYQIISIGVIMIGCFGYFVTKHYKDSYKL
ncbi:MAG: prolipoprotein diacylglyceryl transferase [Candidatus Ancaeobacter aquaticus]|nr:prolipoprotein diacylglyceryl transferase [Candidatus Ancaeobacter aquaticus]